MSTGIYQYPVKFTVETESGNAVALACGEIDDGKAWKVVTTVTEYENDYSITSVSTYSGEIIVNLDGTCEVPEPVITYDPELEPGQTVSEWLDEAGEQQSQNTTYSDEITAAAIKAAAEAAIVWDGSPTTNTYDLLNLPQWQTNSASPLSLGLVKSVSEYAGGCDINTQRIKATRLGASMDHIPMLAGWEGEVMADLTDDGTSTGWLEASTTARDFGVRIGPY